MKTPIYLVEKSTGHIDENGVELYYTVAARLTRASAEQDFEDEIGNGARVRKIVATK
jgi:hypothetical protein